MFLNGVKARFEELVFVSPKQVVSCTETEITSLELQVQSRLPGAYREFLLWMGHGAGSFLRGSDCWYEDLSHIQAWAAELLEEDNFPTSLPNDAFVIWMHQGYQFSFFRLSEGNDPPIYYYLEMQESTALSATAQHFSTYLLGLVEANATLTTRLRSL